jgi:hypothetical protein
LRGSEDFSAEAVGDHHVVTDGDAEHQDLRCVRVDVVTAADT